MIALVVALAFLTGHVHYQYFQCVEGKAPTVATTAAASCQQIHVRVLGRFPVP